MLSLLIASYSEPSILVAIDEMDSGLFEYLLGQLIKVLSISSRGQIVFTSHNLKPLEVLPSKYLCFTTTNPNNRFVTIPKRIVLFIVEGYNDYIEISAILHSPRFSRFLENYCEAFYYTGHDITSDHSSTESNILKRINDIIIDFRKHGASYGFYNNMYLFLTDFY